LAVISWKERESCGDFTGKGPDFGCSLYNFFFFDSNFYQEAIHRINVYPF